MPVNTRQLVRHTVPRWPLHHVQIGLADHCGYHEDEYVGWPVVSCGSATVIRVDAYIDVSVADPGREVPVLHDDR